MTLDWTLILAALPILADGAAVTAQVGLASGLIAVVLGAALAAFAALPGWGPRLLAGAYVDLMRGLPPLVLILIAFYVLPEFGLMLSPMATGTVALGVYYAAYVAEVVRGAVRAIPPGQAEAGLVIGMSRQQILYRVTLPQALALLLPPLGGLLIGLVKESALLSVISVAELTFQAKQAVSRTYAPFEIYALAAIGYWATTAAIDVAVRRLEARVTRYRTALPAANASNGVPTSEASR